VIWAERGAPNSRCRVFTQQSSADEAASARRADGFLVTVVDTRWGVRSVLSSDEISLEAEGAGDTQIEAGNAG
jgi:hypothetical protein